MTALDLFGWSPTAEFSPCDTHPGGGCSPSCEGRPYRYSLTRRWADGPAMLFIALNPSTADETANDPTVTRMMGFARRERYSALTVANLFAFRATDPREMFAASDPVGPENDAWLQRLAAEHELRVAAWGAHGNHRMRDLDVSRRGLLGDLHCLARTKDGHPGHPLYLPTGAPLERWP